MHMGYPWTLDGPLLLVNASTCPFAAAALAGAAGLVAGPVEYSHSCARRTWRACICLRSEDADKMPITAMQLCVGEVRKYIRAQEAWLEMQ